jgi:transcriptional regulator with XRE-family HTH domain
MEQELPNITIFQELKKIRNKKKIKLANIAKSSRIQLEYLEAMEEGDILKLPEVYDKLFFRSYLKYLGVDEDYYYNEFIKYRKKIRIDKTTTMINFTGEKDTEHKILNYKNLIVILPLVIVVFVIWFLVRSTEILETKPKQEVQEIDIQTIVEEIEKEKKAQDDSLVEFQSHTLLNLELNGLEKTWFRVVVDKSDTTEYLINKGEHMRLEADKSFEFLIGRADGLKLQLNGRNFDILGPDSMIISYMLIDSSGIAAKRLKIPASKAIEENNDESS